MTSFFTIHVPLHLHDVAFELDKQIRVTKG